MLSTLGGDMVGALAYAGVGGVLMAVGYLLVDLATPGRLRDLIWVDRNRNAALLLASGLIGVGVIVIAAIVASAGNLAEGLAGAAGYGLMGLLLMALSFLVIDLLTPGRLGEVICEEGWHPGTWVSASAHLAVSGIIAAAIL